MGYTEWDQKVQMKRQGQNRLEWRYEIWQQLQEILKEVCRLLECFLDEIHVEVKNG